MVVAGWMMVAMVVAGVDGGGCGLGQREWCWSCAAPGWELGVRGRDEVEGGHAGVVKGRGSTGSASAAGEEDRKMSVMAASLTQDITVAERDAGLRVVLSDEADSGSRSPRRFRRPAGRPRKEV